MAQGDTCDKYAVQIPERVSSDFVGESDFGEDVFSSNFGAAGFGGAEVANVVGAAVGSKAYEEVADPSNLSDCSVDVYL